MTEGQFQKTLKAICEQAKKEIRQAQKNNGRKK